MKKFLLLFKNYLKLNFKFTQNGKAVSMKTKVLYGFVYAYLIGLMFFMCNTAIKAFAPSFIAQDLTAELFSLVLLVSQIAMLVLGFALFIGRLYVSDDNEKIGYMPLSANQIFWAKFMSSFVWFFAINFVILTSCLIGYLSVASFSGQLLLAYLLALIFAPLFSMLLSCILAVIIIPVFNKLKKNKIILSVVLITLICVVFYYYFKLINSEFFLPDAETGLIALSTSAVATIKSIANIFFFNTAIGQVVNGTASFENMCLFVVYYVALFIINAIIGRYIVDKSNKKSYEKAEDIVKNQLSLGVDAEKALLKKELITLARFPSFLVYCSVSLILAPIALFFLFSNDTSAVGAFAPLVLFALLIFLCGGMQMFALSSFTREGGQFYFTKTLPLTFKQIANIKLKIALFANYVCLALSLIVALLFANLAWYMYIIIFSIVTIVSTALAILSTLYDAKSPRLVWENIYSALQNNISSLKILLIAMTIIIAFAIVFVLTMFTLPPLFASILSWSISATIAIVLLCISVKKYRKNIEKYLQEVE